MLQLLNVLFSVIFLLSLCFQIKNVSLGTIIIASLLKKVENQEQCLSHFLDTTTVSEVNIQETIHMKPNSQISKISRKLRYWENIT